MNTFGLCTGRSGVYLDNVSWKTLLMDLVQGNQEGAGGCQGGENGGGLKESKDTKKDDQKDFFGEKKSEKI